MDIQTRKISFVQEFLKLQSEEIIIGLEQLLKSKKIELQRLNEKPMSMDQLENEIDKSLKDISNGDVIEASELKNKILGWD